MAERELSDAEVRLEFALYAAVNGELSGEEAEWFRQQLETSRTLRQLLEEGKRRLARRSTEEGESWASNPANVQTIRDTIALQLFTDSGIA